MIETYERPPSAKDKKILQKEIDFAKASYPRLIKSLLVKLLYLVVFVTIIFEYPGLWLIIPMAVIALPVIWFFTQEVGDLRRLPEVIKVKEEGMENAVVSVREIKIDRYIKIKEFEDEGDHYILEHEGRLVLIGGQHFDGVRKLKNSIVFIDIMDTEKKFYFNERIEKRGENLTPYYTFKKNLPKALFESDLWNNLSEEPFPGKLEDFDAYIEIDKG